VSAPKNKKNLAPNTSCKVCGAYFYASPGHLEKGWGTTCSVECRSKAKRNGRFIDNDVRCKGCGNPFHVKPSLEKSGRGKVFCSPECRSMTTSEEKTCLHCGSVFSVPKSHSTRRKYCSATCRSEAALNSKPNCTCQTCGSSFYTKPSDLARGIGAGSFCSVSCMTKGRTKDRIGDGKFASHLERELYVALKDAGLLVGMEREVRFHSTRKWRFDFAWQSVRLAVEVQGGIWLGSRGSHTSAKGRERDCEKNNEAALDGWRVLQVTSTHIKSGEAVAWIERALA
jgi:very-short-patch-repair endonuclease